LGPELSSHAARCPASAAFGAVASVVTISVRLGGAASVRPDQRRGLRQVADEIVGEGEQHGIHPRLHHGADQPGLGRGKREFPGQRRQRPAAVRIGLGLEEPAHERDLRQAPWGQGQPVQQFGEGDHESPSSP
jgi:hypothetical protein